MAKKNWQAGYLVLILLLFALLAMNWTWPEEGGEESPDDLRAYLPALVGMTYHYEGMGMEFASFTRRLTFAAQGLLQLEDLSGTNLAQVVERRQEEIKVIYAEKEFYEGESLLEEAVRRSRPLGRSVDLILLKAPPKVGTNWQDQQFQREITAVGEVVEVPLGVFYDVAVVKSRSRDGASGEIYEYYAKNVGLIKREFILESEGETFTVTSSLKALSFPPAM